MRLISTILPILANVIAVPALYCTADGIPWPDEAGPGQVCNKHLFCCTSDEIGQDSDIFTIHRTGEELLDIDGYSINCLEGFGW
ncbi:hypothetical protein HYALB_00003411 [Hymenoscyphus albidus]|uniref:Hydrophobin n=1 Tax=Hymenoscyphus albidus TaxID=595503 RepID=A0A9N9LDI9_9HELO|nr:hypothetical protein HYALB_00003411 [Hymenoscyphus albidus]